ncbi:MAG: nitrite reductase (NADH) small subunit [Pirellulaceae bacterium]|jgi:nitrite reductase (NADH) small subunit
MNKSAEFRNICKVTDIPEGEAKMFVVGEKPIGVYHVAGKFYALGNECPHAGASLAHGIIAGATVSCRIHHWKFSICDGKYLDEQKDDCDLPTFEVRIDGEDVLVKMQLE